MQLDRSFLIVCLFFFNACSTAEPNSWSYKDFSSGTVLILREGNLVIFSGHIGNEWENCDPSKSEYLVCFQSEKLAMKLPKKALLEGHWVENGRKYSLVSRQGAHFLGESIGDVYMVTSDEYQKRGFVYSLERGVIGIFSSFEESSDFVILEGKCGYAAPSGCYK